MYSDRSKNGFAPVMSFDQGRDAWAVRLKKGKQEFMVYLKIKDAAACIDATFCEDFGTEIAQKRKEYSKG